MLIVLLATEVRSIIEYNIKFFKKGKIKLYSSVK